MGFIPETQLRGEPDVYNAVSKLKQGEITEILPVYNGTGSGRRIIGYAIYKLVAREPAGQREFERPARAAGHPPRPSRRPTRPTAAERLLRSAHDEAKVHNYFADQILKQGAR